jgi:hypothetical protein
MESRENRDMLNLKYDKSIKDLLKGGKLDSNPRYPNHDQYRNLINVM